MNSDIHRAIARIDVVRDGVSRRRGTGFLVAPRLVLTALHVVAERRPDPPDFLEGEIVLRFGDVTLTGRVVDYSWDRIDDWVLIDCDDEPQADPVTLGRLLATPASWSTFGFPDAYEHGLAQGGVVESLESQVDGTRVLQLFSRQAAAGRGSRVRGWSGSPVVVDGVVVGHLRWALMEDGRAEAGTEFACPMESVHARCADRLPALRDVSSPPTDGAVPKVSTGPRASTGDALGAAAEIPGAMRNGPSVGSAQQDAMLGNVSSEFLTQLLARVSKEALAQATRPSVSDLFQVIRDPEGVPAAFFEPLAPGTRVLPYGEDSVPYVASARADGANTHEQIANHLGQLLVLLGGRGTGKTREAQEVAGSYCANGWTVCLARLSHRRKMGAADELLTDARLLFVIDDLHKHAVRASVEQAGYWDRLQAFIDPYLRTPGVKVRVLITSEPMAGDAHLPPEGHPLRPRAAGIELPAFDANALSGLLLRVAENAGLEVTPEQASALVVDSNASPKTVVVNVDWAVREGRTLSPEHWLQTWDGRWPDAFRETRALEPAVVSVFRSLHLLEQAGLSAREDVVVELTTALGEGDAMNAITSLVDSGQLVRRGGQLKVFADNQLGDCLDTLDEPLPALPENWDLLIDTVDRVAQANPEALGELAALTEVLTDESQWERAETVATRVIEHDPIHEAALRSRALARVSLLNLTDAHSDASRLLDLQPDDHRYLSLRGSVRLMLRDYEGAESDLGAVIESGDSKALKGRALCRAMDGRLDDAEADMSALLDAGEGGVNERLTLGFFRFQLGRLKDAVTDFGAVLDEEPGNGTARLLRVFCYQSLEQHLAAADDLGFLLEATPSAFFFGVRAVNYQRAGLLQEAYADCTNAILHASDDSMSGYLASMARVMDDPQGDGEVPQEFLDETVEVWSAVGMDLADVDVARVPFFRDWMTRQMALLRERDSGAGFRLWATPAATFQQLRGEIQLQRELVDEAEADFRAALDAGGDRASIHTMLARCRTLDGDLEGSERHLDEALLAAPGTAHLHAQRGAVRYDRARLEPALEDLEAARAGGIEVPVLNALRGKCLFKLGRSEEAQVALEAALAGNDADAPSHYLLAAIRFNRGEFAEAIAGYDRAATRGFDSPSLFVERGLAHLELSDLEAAKADEEAATARDGSEPGLSKLRAMLHLHAGELSEAEEQFTFLLDAIPSDPQTLFLRGCARLALGKHAEAEADFTGILAAGIETADVYAHRGIARARHGRQPEAMEDLDRAIALDPDDTRYPQWRTELASTD